ncbi:oxaloacetate decarboxylase [Reyranella sp. CPCC 100927]|uniref:isocitrate lyase/PEP mutase family protein n=1 Tax=Reyranella sp. CPCC 100927 TaxID=2599616 RepID=UPI0015B3AC84|nr:isocitrate lyase/PEP mutase family protein [Reyranella sp. CPCC 100927]
MALTPAARLRQHLQSRKLVVAPSCPDPFFARIAQDAGFAAVALGGYAMGAQTGITEPLLTMSEVVEASRRMVGALDIPVIVDGGAGFGDPLHTMRTIRELEQVGVAAVHVEDQVFPKRAHYHRQYQEHVIPAEEMALKIAYAVEARRNPDFVIIARTDAMQTDGYDEAVRRARLYAEAGADMVMLFPNNDAEARQAPRDCGVPLVYVNSTGNRAARPIYGIADLQAMGYAACVDAISVAITGYTAVRDLLGRLRDTGRVGIDPAQAHAARLEIERLIGLETYYQIEEKTVERAASA